MCSDNMFANKILIIVSAGCPPPTPDFLIATDHMSAGYLVVPDMILYRLPYVISRLQRQSPSTNWCNNLPRKRVVDLIIYGKSTVISCCLGRMS